MSMFFPRFNDFSPLFRVADELDRSTRNGQGFSSTQQSPPTRSFAPRFDVHETKEVYELHGELPGVAQENLGIEWSDNNTLIIFGHTEKIDSHDSDAIAVVDVSDTASQSSSPHYQKPTVEEETAPAEQALSKADSPKELSKTESSKSRCWISERSYGSFHRTFQFPAHVNQEGVKASLKNGILKIVVPKAKAREPRKITIQ